MATGTPSTGNEVEDSTTIMKEGRKGRVSAVKVGQKKPVEVPQWMCLKGFSPSVCEFNVSFPINVWLTHVDVFRVFWGEPAYMGIADVALKQCFPQSRGTPPYK
jgi:hypothetical protein